MRPAREVTRFRGGGPAARANDSRDIHLLAMEVFDEGVSSGVIAYSTHGQNSCGQIDEIVRGIRAAARDYLCLLVTQNQNGRFARDARDFSGDVFVDDEIAENDDGLPRKCRDNIQQAGQIGRMRAAIGFFSRATHRSFFRLCPRFFSRFWITFAPKIRSTAAVRSSTTLSGWRGQSPRWYSYSPRP